MSAILFCAAVYATHNKTGIIAIAAASILCESVVEAEMLALEKALERMPESEGYTGHGATVLEVNDEIINAIREMQ